MKNNLKIRSFIKRCFWPFLFLFLYIVTMPENYSEAEDIYDFALRVESGKLHEQLGINRLLALPIFAVFYQFVNELGFEVSAFLFISHLNQLLAVGSLLIFRHILFIQLSIKYDGTNAHRISILGAVLLGISYGFWRYSSVPETYILANFVLCLAWLFVLHERVWIGSFISGLGVLIHLLNGIPLIIGISCFYLFQKKIKLTLIHGFTSIMIVIIGYGIFWKMLDLNGLGAQNHPIEGGWRIQNFGRGAIAFGQCLISGNFLFGFNWFNDLLIDLFPSRMLSEEQFLGSKMPKWIPWIGILSFMMVLFSAILTFKPMYLLRYSSPFIRALWIWLLIYVIAIIQIESGSMELWILALIPFWLIVAHCIEKKWALILIISILIHNGIAGILPLKNKQSDYHYMKSFWLLENISNNDIILVDYEPILISYLKYNSMAKIINSSDYKLAELKELITNTDGKVWAFNSFFEPMSSMKLRNKDIFYNQTINSEKLKQMFILEYEDIFGGVYRKKD